MKHRIALVAALVAAAAVCTDATAQTTGTVSGQVLNSAAQQPIPGVQVFVVGTGRGSLTNQNGQYAITNVPAGTRTVRALIIGFSQTDQSITVVAGQNTQAVFALRPSAIELDAIVVNAVTGRAERKRELGTNTASITAADIARAPITKMADVLTARAPGVQVQAPSGSVGTSQRIRIRGANSISLSNEPLIVVDGILTSNSKGGFSVGGQDYSRLNDINYDDIGDVEILKGPAATALYGTAAANGVILITTKRGQVGSAKWHSYVEAGSSRDKNPYPLNFLSFQVTDATKPMFTARGNLNPAGYKFCPNIDVAAGTCKQDQVLSLNAFTDPALTPFTNGHRNKYGTSVSGGSETVNYFLSGDYDYEQGVIAFNNDRKINVRANVGAHVTEDLNLNVNVGYTRNNLVLNSNDNSSLSPLINAALATPFVFNDSIRNPLNSKPAQRPGTGFGFFLSDIEQFLAYQAVDRFIVSSTGSYRPLSWVSLNATLGLDYFGRNDQKTLQPGRVPIAATFTPGYRENQRSSNYIYTANGAGVVTRKLITDLISTTTLGSSFQRELFQSTYCYGVGVVEGTRSCGATSSLFAVDEGYSEVKTVGAYVQEQLNWRDRLIVSGSVRGDDNSAFGQDYGFIYYPGVSASWVASDESFFPKGQALSNFRMRAAFGKSGQRPNFRDAVTLFDPVSVSSNNLEVPAVRLRSVGNVKLRPERTTEIEGGFDAGLLNDKLSLEFTIYQKKSQDALVARPLPPSFGLTGDNASSGTIFDNLGSIKNRGTEVALNARVLDKKNVALNLRLGASTLKNRIENLGANIKPIIFNRGTQAHKQGYPAGSFFSQRYEIVNPNEQRLLKKEDVKLIDTDTTVFLGPSLPTNTQLASGDLTLFRRFTITGLVERRAGMMSTNGSELFRCTTGYNRGATGAAGGQCAGVADPNASVEDQARFIAQRFLNTSAGFIEDASFIKLRELSLTVMTPDGVPRWASMLRGSSLTLSGRNLKTWTDYRGIDPEINESGGGANFTQGEQFTQPALRYYTARINFVF